MVFELFGGLRRHFRRNKMLPTVFGFRFKSCQVVCSNVCMVAHRERQLSAPSAFLDSWEFYLALGAKEFHILSPAGANNVHA